jgi:hypothetical protein
MQAPDATDQHERQPARLAYSLDHFCEMSDIGRTKAYELIRTGKLRAKKLGSKTLILAEDADRGLASLPDMPAAEAA